MLKSLVTWISIMVVVLGAGYVYIGKRLISTMSWTRPVKAAARIGLAVMFFVPVISLFLFRHVETFGSGWSWITYVGLGFLSLICTTLVFRDLLLLGARGIGYLLSLFRSVRLGESSTSRQLLESRGPVGSRPPLRNPERRAFLLQSSNVAVIGVAGVLTAYGVYQARRKPGIVNLDIPIRNLPEAFEGFRIVQITDIHAGLTVRRDWVEVIVQEVAGLQPDLIAFTGDMADGSVPYLRDDVAPFSELKAPYGKFFVTGNHEYYSGAEQWIEEATRMGYKVLMNEHQRIARNGAQIVLAGVTDYSASDFFPQQKSDPGKAVEGAPADTVKILMAHQPRSVYAADPLRYNLIISGHTHGGQFFPWNFVATLGQPYIKGLHNRNGTWVYVSKGTGYWGPPVRLGARSEITVFSLKRADAT